MRHDLDQSYAHCRQVVRGASSNLAWCFWLLPRDQRRAMDALYAFARRADDLVDADEPLEQRRQGLAAFRADLAAALAGEPKPPLLPAVADSVRRFSIAPALLMQLLDGVAMDLEPRTPATFAELHAYCYRVASAVGLACLPIWGCTDERAIAPAIDCGIAFQLTNILRDLAEDASRGRCYLPADELERFGVISSRHTPCVVSWSEPLAELIDFQLARARNYYESAAETARYLPPPGRRVFSLMLARYRSILAAIERDPKRILRERVSLSWPKKVAVAAIALLASPRSNVQSPKPPPLSTLDLGHWTTDLPKVAIVGGGLAGLAAAAALCQRGVLVELFESRQKLGGRAGSYFDQQSGELIDHCQHVAMGCCTNFLDFCRQTGSLDLLTRHRKLHFFGPDGKRCEFRPGDFMPAPLHLAAALWSQMYLSAADRFAIAAALLRLARLQPLDEPQSPTIGQWLREQHQSPAAIERFWQVVLVSALGEALERASLAAARKVFVDGFLAARSACEVFTPHVPLGELYDRHVADWLRQRGVRIHLGSPVSQVVDRSEARVRLAVALKDGDAREYDFVIAALPWRRLPEVLSPELAAKVPNIISAARSIEPSPITGIHLWFDRPITDLPHAVLVGRLAQWVFARQVQSPKSKVQSRRDFRVQHEASEATGESHDLRSFYYQVVISASHDLAGRAREDVLSEVIADLHAVFPQSRDARLVHWQLITDWQAVFSVRPGMSHLRPGQRTEVSGLVLAGDWTATLWPATMEGAVRSGYLAAEAVLESLGRRHTIVVPDLPRGWLARWLIGADPRPPLSHGHA